MQFYATASGKEPVRDWLRGFGPEIKRRIGEDLKAVQFGWPIGMPLVRKMEPGLWELRSSIPGGIARVLFTVVGAHIVLLHGFVKKQQRTSRQDLDLALRRRDEVHHDRA
ncbi:type II toxin-antitoxin system RelE/ParE family toxin [Metallibacterium sp.]|uniref:type II toxin-antitoxin system RelE/ParE family toxin n=1 Tax=Metallibacterium sp. TaxID=2940281 RepID=UPI00261B4214|nr:type II toxin-antitoxin system RelE/ParE family toxin [Metallibacterium sp.]